MITGTAADVVATVLLVGVLGFAIARPRGLPEATVAVPAAVLTVAFGLLSPSAALAEVRTLAPTVGFLAAILVLAHLSDVEGVFRWLGDRLADACGGRPRQLLTLVFAAASATTAVLSLDATVVLLTPVVFDTAVRLRLRAKPHVYACTHLANSASILLPVSNLTNLLAFGASGLSFLGFAALMGLPWLAAIAAEYLVFRMFFRPDLGGTAARADRLRTPSPRIALGVLGGTLVGFGLSEFVGVPPVWVAVLGAAGLAVRALARRDAAPRDLVRAASPLFCLFVVALGVVVTGLTAHGLGAALAELVPHSTSLAALLAVAGVAAVLANLVNNLPAILVTLGALGNGAHPGLVLAALIGVNIGPNLTYVGSLATMLWRRTLTGGDAAPTLREFGRLGLLTVPVALVAAVCALWWGLTVGRGWLPPRS